MRDSHRGGLSSRPLCIAVLWSSTPARQVRGGFPGVFKRHPLCLNVHVEMLITACSRMAWNLLARASLLGIYNRPSRPYREATFRGLAPRFNHRDFGKPYSHGMEDKWWEPQGLT